ncbi:MAG TPA: hypothetical protein VNH11_21000 [Pirellulales bacterium]|nr:hypothetical protein [Pirellulales bacterium]
MPRSQRRPAVAATYAGVLEKLLPRLEELLCGRLQRLEAKVAVHESRHGLSAVCADSQAMMKTRCPVDADLGAGTPSVIVLGARLRSDQRYCRTLIYRVATIFRAKLKRA